VLGANPLYLAVGASLHNKMVRGKPPVVGTTEAEGVVLGEWREEQHWTCRCMNESFSMPAR
jgi:hypothetical protein